jgi:predicted transcriptional regulator
MNQSLTVKDVMSKPVAIAKSAPISEALAKMLDEGTDPIVVTHDHVVVGTASRKTIAEKMGSRKTGNIPASQIRVASVTREDFTAVYQDQEAGLLVPLLQNYKLVVVWDEEHRLVGQVTTGDLLKVMKPEGTLEEMTETAPKISPDDRIVQLHRRMVNDGATRFIVMDGQNAAGIVTETDIARVFVRLKSEIDKHLETALRNITAKDVMSSPLITIPSGTPAEKVAELMLARKISTIPVAENGRVTGLVTRKSLIDAL